MLRSSASAGRRSRPCADQRQQGQDLEPELDGPRVRHGPGPMWRRRTRRRRVRRERGIEIRPRPAMPPARRAPSFRRTRGPSGAPRDRGPRCGGPPAAECGSVHVEEPVGLGEHFDRVALPLDAAVIERRSSWRCCESQAERKCGSSNRRRMGRSSSVSLRSITWRVAASASCAAAVAVARSASGAAICVKACSRSICLASSSELAHQRQVGHDEPRGRAWPMDRWRHEPVHEAVVELEVGREIVAARRARAQDLGEALRSSRRRSSPVVSSSAMFES